MDFFQNRKIWARSDRNHLVNILSENISHLSLFYLRRQQSSWSTAKLNQFELHNLKVFEVFLLRAF
jgi:hypothetical protein